MQADSKSTSTYSVRIFSAIVIGLLGLLFWLVPAIPQDPAYHDFADQRNIMGISNFWNVASNLPFLFAGAYGLVYLAECDPQQRPFTRVYSVGLLLICLGSSWYHLAPDNESLAWDRLTMTISFMAFFAFILSRIISVQFGSRALWPLIGIGLFSVIYWSLTERSNAGDLRLYAIVQFLPAILVPVFLLSLPHSFVPASRKWLWLGLVAYMAAKLAEWQDVFIYDLPIMLSGHSVKHILAALSSYYFVRVLLASNAKA